MIVQPSGKNSTRDRFNISRLAIRYSWLTLGFWLAVIVAGIFAFSSLKYALFPDVTFPVVVVNTTAPLTTASETELKLTVPIEKSLNSLPGLEDIRSSTYPGQSVVSLSFAVGTNLESSQSKVSQELKNIKLIEGSDFQVIPINLNESAAITYAIESPSRNLTDLTQLTKDKIQNTLVKVPGVLKVNLLGVYPETLTRFNSQEALAIQIIKKGSANTLEVVNLVESEVQKLRQTLPDTKISLASTQAEYIRKATRATVDSLIEAIILSIVVIYPFLRNWQATIISALAIPTSLLGTAIVMAIFGFNLETITLLALALVIGSIIDDAIVDVENIMRHIDEGETPRQAAISATNEIGLTVTAATFTAVAVFLPIGLMGGVIGQFFKPFGITVAAAMLISMLLARTLSPVLAVYWIKPKTKIKSQYQTQSWGYFAQIYQNILQWSLQHRLIVMVLAMLSFILAIALIPAIPKGFIPKLDRGEFNIAYTTPLPDIKAQQAAQQEAFASLLGDSGDNSGNLTPTIRDPIDDSLEVAKKLEVEVRKFPDVETIFTTVGSREGEPNKGKIYVKLKEKHQIKTADIQTQLRTSLPKLPGVSTSVEDIQFVDTGGQKPLQIALLGNNTQTLNQTAQKIKQSLQKLPGFADITATGDGEENKTIQNIERFRSQRVAYVAANLGQNLSLGDATDKVVAEAKKIIPKDIKLDLGGDSARLGEVLGSFVGTLGLSALCIIAVLIWLFKGWVDPIVIGISLPLAIVGAMVALLVTKSEFGMISLIGFVFLLGLSNKNAILLVDYINQLRASGMNRSQAILKAAPIRFRPIMMTTISTILGMVPIAVGLGTGSELRSPMAIAIAGGLISSTILSLIVVPILYSILDDWFPRKRFKPTLQKELQ
ncbi:efflux RND transporter permease subunit [Calothrix sp. PCC 6303]|uniref:efflux RND transporter permease subunit n=1 Tax=Calothrix sp. PCC 6303 TaxID=1170562 RepID=UPI0002A0152A|nr:efflux RND transporter permease subunit [Calothrix sp. PCC 6303]AFZ02113.1 acriflavin resistance protein [Calothrix sp. PCC 6303]